jgi:error-prone DNA polymerase
LGFVELHCHSAYSFLDGASHPEDLAARGAELGYEALALTDHDGVYGSLEFAHAAKAFGVRPITGAEVTLRERSHGQSPHDLQAAPPSRREPGGLRKPLPAPDRRPRGHQTERGRRAAPAGS